MKLLRMASLAACIFLLAATATVGWGQQSPAVPTPHTTGAPAYRISGKVIDAHTGAPVARCSVQIADVKDRGQPMTTISADDGTFSFDRLPLGKYSLSAERRGYLQQSYEEHDVFSTAIAVGPGLVSEDLLFHLTAEAILGGTVTDEAGEPVRGAQVRLFEDQNSSGIRTTQQRHTAVTDDRGVYELPGLKPGAYFLVVTAHPWYAQRLQEENAPSGGGTQALDVAYPTTFYPGVTDQDSATPIPVKGGERLEANLTLAAQQALRLKLNAPGGEASRGVSVMLTQTIFGQVENLPAQMTFRPNGAIEVEGVLPGHYDVALSRFTPGEGRGDTKHFNADLTGGATELSEDGGVGEVAITGRVIAPAGKLPRSAGIALRSPHGGRRQYSTLNENGEFNMEVSPGAFEVVGGINGMYIASMKVTGATLAGRMLTVKAGDSPKLEITAGSGHGEIEGTVLRAGKPASAVMVLLAPEDPKDNEVLFSRDQTDSDGTFDLPNVVPGRYRLLAIEEGWNLEWANAAVLQAFLPKSVPLEVKSGDHLHQQIEVQVR